MTTKETTVVSFTIPGKPIALPRERVAIVGGKPRHYREGPIVAYQQAVRMIARQHCRVLTGLVAVELQFWFAKPRRTKWDAGPGGKPDLDNLVKGVLDALKGVAWLDDAQVVGLDARKGWGKESMTVVRIVSG